MRTGTGLVLCLLVVCQTGSAMAAEQNQDLCPEAMTQLAMNQCWGEHAKAADAELNRVYKVLMAMLDEDGKVKLKLAEEAWIKFRDTNCDFQADCEFRGGSARPMAYAICIMQVTNTRTKQLEMLVKERQER